MKKLTKTLLYVLSVLLIAIIIFFIANKMINKNVSNEEKIIPEQQDNKYQVVSKNNLPESFKANYISFQNYGSGIYPIEVYPKLESWVENGQIECNETPQELSTQLRISKREINGHKYCIGASSEGAAGSVYTQYAYTTVINDKVYMIKFVARYVNCSNYPEEKMIECSKEREQFNLDLLVNQEIEKTIK